MTRRRLPHDYSEGCWLFVTWHLHGSLPRAMYPPPGKPNAGQAFVWMDRYLDSTRHGPMFLREEAVAEIVLNAILRGAAAGHYELGPFVIMANHVHLLLRPLIDPPRLLQSLKGTTARAANLLLGRTGQPFWQQESYDRRVRTAQEWERIAAYIGDNPVRAGLVAHAEEYRWSSAFLGNSAEAAPTLVGE